MVFFKEYLRLGQHESDPDVLYGDAVLTVTGWNRSEDAKFVGAFLKHAPSRGGQLSVARDIVALRKPAEKTYRETMEKHIEPKDTNSDKFREWRHIEFNATGQAGKELSAGFKDLAAHYKEAILRPFKGLKKPATMPLNPNWPKDKKDFVDVKRASRADKRKDTIKRDKYRCCATARIDVDIADLPPDDRDVILKERLPEAAGKLESLQVAHVFPFGFNNFANTTVGVQKAKVIWTAFKKFSGYKVTDLSGEEINGIKNLFMLSPVAHKLYDRLDLWFEPVAVDNTIRTHTIKISTRFLDNALQTIISDKVQLKDGVDGVDRRWLAIHRSICLVNQEHAGLVNGPFALKAKRPDDDNVDGK